MKTFSAIIIHLTCQARTNVYISACYFLEIDTVIMCHTFDLRLAQSTCSQLRLGCSLLRFPDRIVDSTPQVDTTILITTVCLFMVLLSRQVKVKL